MIYNDTRAAQKAKEFKAAAKSKGKAKAQMRPPVGVERMRSDGILYE